MQQSIQNKQGYILSISQTGSQAHVEIKDQLGRLIQGNVTFVFSHLNQTEASENFLFRKLQECVSSKNPFSFYVHKENGLKQRVAIEIGSYGLKGGGRDADMFWSTAALATGIFVTAATGGLPGAIIGGLMTGGAGSRIGYCWNRKDNERDPDKKYDANAANNESVKGAFWGALGGGFGGAFMPAGATLADKAIVQSCSTLTTKVGQKAVENELAGKNDPVLTAGDVASAVVASPASVVMNEKLGQTFNGFAAPYLKSNGSIIFARGFNGALASSASAATKTVLHNAVTGNSRGLYDGMGSEVYIAALTGGIQESWKTVKMLEEMKKAILEEAQNNAQTQLTNAQQTYNNAADAYKDYIQGLVNNGYSCSTWGQNVDAIFEQVVKYGHTINMKNGSKHVYLTKPVAIKNAETQLTLAQSAMAGFQDTTAVQTSFETAQLIFNNEVDSFRNRVQDLINQGYYNSKWKKDVDAIVEQVLVYGHTIHMRHPNGGASIDLEQPQSYITAQNNLQLAEQVSKRMADALAGANRQEIESQLTKAQNEAIQEEAKLREKVQKYIDRGYQSDKCEKDVDAIVEQVVRYGHTINLKKGDHHKYIKPTAELRDAQSRIATFSAALVALELPSIERMAQLMYNAEETKIRDQIQQLLDDGFKVKDKRLAGNVDAILEQVVKYGHVLTFRKGDYETKQVQQTPKFIAAKLCLSDPKEAQTQLLKSENTRNDEHRKIRRQIQSLIDQGYHIKNKKIDGDVDLMTEQVVKYGHRLNFHKNGESKIVERSAQFNQATQEISAAKRVIATHETSDPLNRYEAFLYAGEAEALLQQIKSLFKRGYHVSDKQLNDNAEAVLEQILQNHRITFHKKGKHDITLKGTPELWAAKLNMSSLPDAMQNLENAEINLAKAEESFRERVKRLSKDYRPKDKKYTPEGGFDIDYYVEQVLKYGHEIAFHYGNDKKILRLTPELREARENLLKARQMVSTAIDRAGNNPVLWASRSCFNTEVEKLKAQIQSWIDKGYHITDKSLDGNADLIAEQIVKWGRKFTFEYKKGKTYRPSETVEASSALKKAQWEIFQQRRDMVNRDGIQSETLHTELTLFKGHYEELIDRVYRLLSDGYREPGTRRYANRALAQEIAVRVAAGESVVLVDKGFSGNERDRVVLEQQPQLRGAISEVVYSTEL